MHSALDPSLLKTLQRMRLDAGDKNNFKTASIRWLDGYSSKRLTMFNIGIRGG